MSEKCELVKTRVRIPEALFTATYCLTHKQAHSNCLVAEIKQLRKDVKAAKTPTPDGK